MLFGLKMIMGNKTKNFVVKLATFPEGPLSVIQVSFKGFIQPQWEKIIQWSPL